MMQGRALLDGTKNFLLFLVRAIVFPLAWIWALGLARKHTDTDPNARTKVVAAIVAGVVLAGGSFVMLNDFTQDATTSMYELMDGRIAQADGSAEYTANVDAAAAAKGQIIILQGKLDEARATGDTVNESVFEASLLDALDALAVANTKIELLSKNKALHDDMKPMFQARDDAAIEAAIREKAAAWSDSDYAHPTLEAAKDPVDFTIENMILGMKSAFYKKNKYADDMAMWFNLLILPGLIGVFYAPLSFALGNVLKRAWVPSDSVGFKEYPGASMAWFLLLGAFGIPALFFAAWTFWDMDVRSREGQISL